MKNKELIVECCDLINNSTIKITTNRGEFYFDDNSLYWGEPKYKGENKLKEPEEFQKKLFEKVIKFLNTQNKTYNSVIISSIVNKNIN